MCAERQQAQISQERELAKVQKQLDQMVEAVCNGMYHPSMNRKMADLEARKAKLVEAMDNEQEEPLRLHPGLSEVYRAKVADLTEALNAEGTRGQAAELIRGLLTEIRLIPTDGALAIELVGELAGIMGLGEENQGEAAPGRILVVAGARCQRYLPGLSHAVA